MLVERYKEHAWIGVKGILRAVAVMHVPVHDHHTFQAKGITRMVRRNNSIVEDAEAHGAITHSVMPRWSQQRVSIVHLALHNGLHSVHGPTRGKDRRVERASTERR